MKKYVTLKDIAQDVGVSVSTVSRVINDYPYVDKHTKKKILQAITKCDYKPNLVARSMKGKGIKTIGVIIPDIRDSLFSYLVKSIENCAYSNGFNVILCDAEGYLEEELSYIDTLMRKNIDGLIIAPVDMNGTYTLLTTSGVPYVQVDRKILNVEADFIGIDNVRDAAEATQHLIDYGYTNIGFIGYEQRFYTMAKRLEGYQKSIKKQGLKENCLLATHAHGGKMIQNEIEPWLRSNKINAVLCGNDDICFETIEAIKKMGLHLSEDVGLLTFDDIGWFAHMKCAITAIRQPAEDIGKISVELLISRINGTVRDGFKNIMLETTLIKRSSCGEQRQ